MTRKQKLEAMRQWKQTSDKIDAEVDALKHVGIDHNIHICERAFECFDRYTVALGELIGDPDGYWLSWYASDCDMGRKPYEAGFDGDMRLIKTLSQLLDLIEATK